MDKIIIRVLELEQALGKYGITIQKFRIDQDIELQLYNGYTISKINAIEV